MNIQPITTGMATLIATETGRPCGEGRIPDGDNKIPYSIVYLLSSGLPEGGMADDHDMRTIMYQVTSVGAGPEEASALADKITALRSRMKTLPGVIYAQVDQIGPATREDGLTYNRNDTLTLRVSST